MAWGYVRSLLAKAQFDGIGGVTTAGTFGGAVAVGDTILVETTVGVDPATRTPTLTDDLGNTYSNEGSLYLSSDGQGYNYWKCIVTSAGTPTLTYTPNGVTGDAWIAFKADHFTGSNASSTVRDKKSATQIHPGTGANAITTASVSAQSGDLLWGGGAMQNPDNTMAIGTGFSATSAIDATTGFLTEYKTASGAGAVTFTDATNGGGRNFATFGMAITPASGADIPVHEPLQHTPQYQAWIAQ